MKFFMSATADFRRVAAHTKSFINQVSEYIQKEIGLGSIIGPFCVNPFTDSMLVTSLQAAQNKPHI